MAAIATFTLTQQKVLAITPKFLSFAAICGDSAIIVEILILNRQKLGRVYHRLLLIMSIYDVVESFFNFASSWPIPRNTPNIAYAVGNTASCTVQGFILQFAIAIPILNMCLSIYYLLVIRYSWSEDKIRKKAEPFFHIVSLGVGLSTACACAAMGMFNNSNLWCWINSLPSYCKDSFTYGVEGDCIRGDNAWIYRWAFFYAELWFCILFVMLAMVAVYMTVRNLELANEKYLVKARFSAPKTSTISSLKGMEGNEESRQSRSQRNCATRITSLWKPVITKFKQRKGIGLGNTKSKRVAHQALLYVGVFYIPFVFSTINRIVQQVFNRTYFSIIVIHALLEPSQGFFNYLVYIRPRFLRYLDNHPTAKFRDALKYFFTGRRREEKARKSPGEYVDDDQEYEEEAKRELAGWRLRLSKDNISGIFRFMVDSESFRTISSSRTRKKRRKSNDDDLTMKSISRSMTRSSTMSSSAGIHPCLKKDAKEGKEEEELDRKRLRVDSNLSNEEEYFCNNIVINNSIQSGKDENLNVAGLSLPDKWNDQRSTLTATQIFHHNVADIGENGDIESSLEHSILQDGDFLTLSLKGDSADLSMGML